MAYFLEIECGRAKKLACETLDELRAFLDSESQLAPSANGHILNGHGSKSDVLRRYFADHPEATAADAHSALLANGVQISAGLASKIKNDVATTGKGRSRRGSRG